MLEKITIVWLIFINLHGLATMFRDKRYSKANSEFHIPTTTFFLIAILGGSLGILLGMLFFRHKMNRKFFTIVVPIILLLEIGLGVYLYLK